MLPRAPAGGDVIAAILASGDVVALHTTSMDTRNDQMGIWGAVDVFCETHVTPVT